MDGYEFEYQCAKILRQKHFSKIEVTRSSGDQGVDIIAFKHSPVVSLQVSFLLNDGASVLLELVHYPCTAFVMCVAVHRSWSEVTLLLTEEISGVGIELRSYSNHCLCVVVCFLCALA